MQIFWELITSLFLKAFERSCFKMRLYIVVIWCHIHIGSGKNKPIEQLDDHLKR